MEGRDAGKKGELTIDYGWKEVSSDWSWVLVRHQLRLTGLQSRNEIKNRGKWTSLVVQWMTDRLPMHGTRVRSLVWEDSTCCRATGPTCHNHWALQAATAEARPPRACAPEGNHHSEKPVHRNSRVVLALSNQRKPMCSNEDQVQPNTNK